MPDWTMGEDKYMETYRGESKFDRDLAPDHGIWPTCEACEAAIAELTVKGRLLCVACAEPKETEMDQPLEQAMRDLAADLRRYLQDDVEYIERRLTAITQFVREIDDRLNKTHALAQEFGRMAAAAGPVEKA